MTISLSNNHDGWKEKTEAEMTVKADPAAKLVGAVLGGEGTTADHDG